MKYQDHPIAAIFPLLDEESLGRLADDIRDHGLNQPIILFEDTILDGRNRYRACIQAKVQPRFTEFTGKDPVSFVISSDAIRRDLTQSQRAAAAVNCEDIVERLRKESKERQIRKPGSVVATLPPQNGEKTRDHLARLFGCGARYIQDTLTIKALSSEVDQLLKAGRS